MGEVRPGAALVLMVGVGAVLSGCLGSPGLADPPEAYVLLDVQVSDEATAVQVGEKIADDLDGLAGAPEGFADAATVQRCNDLLTAFGDDPAVMAPMYERLGADGMMGTFNGLSSVMPFEYPEGGLALLAGGLRSGLESATKQSGFDGEGFGEDLARYATRTFTDDERDAFEDGYPSTGHHAAVLDFLLRDGAYSEDFVRGVAWELDNVERTVDADLADMWMDHNGDGSPLNILGVDDPMDGRRPDPMAAAMGQLGQHPGLGLEFFTEDDSRATHYLGERDWSRDGFEGVAQAALRIGTDPENLANAGRDTGMFVSRYFDTLAGNPAFTAGDAVAGAEPVADLLKHYMPAVEMAISGDGQDRPPGVDTKDHPFIPNLTDYPTMDSADLDKLLQVGLSTDAGMLRIAEGVAHYRNTLLAGFSEMYPGPLDELDPSISPAAREELAALLRWSMGLEGYMQHAVSEIAIESAGSKATARDEQTGVAIDGLNKALITTYLSLVEAGVVEVRPDLADIWAPGGNLISLADIDSDQIGTYSVTAEDSMIGVVLLADLERSYKDPFADWDSE